MTDHDAHDLRDLLARHAFFKGLDEDTMAFVTGCASNVRFPAGTRILTAGEAADHLYLIRAGRVGLEISAPDREPMVVDTLGEGHILGISWLVPPYRWGLDARAMEVTRAIALDATCLRRKCDEDPKLGYWLMQRVAGVLEARLRSARLRLLDLYSHAGSR